MINYSIVMRPVNANLIEINQAKARINAAKANGTAPSADDIALVATETYNAFALAQCSEIVNIEKFAKHIASHGCVYRRADISAVLYLAVDCLRELLLEGKKVCLGDLGTFSLNLSSRGAETAEKFSSQYITDVTVVWDCGKDFRNLLPEAEFNLVAPRTAQAALIRAIKAGENVLDLSKPQSYNGDDDNGDDDNGSDGGSADGNGSGSGSNLFEDE